MIAAAISEFSALGSASEGAPCMPPDIGLEYIQGSRSICQRQNYIHTLRVSTSSDNYDECAVDGGGAAAERQALGGR